MDNRAIVGHRLNGRTDWCSSVVSVPSCEEEQEEHCQSPTIQNDLQEATGVHVSDQTVSESLRVAWGPYTVLTPCNLISISQITSEFTVLQLN